MPGVRWKPIVPSPVAATAGFLVESSQIGWDEKSLRMPGELVHVGVGARRLD